MDVSDILASQAAKHQAVTVEKDIPLEVDAGYLTVTDLNPTDPELYSENVEAYLQATARDGVQVLLASLFSLPTLPSPTGDGPLAQLPPPSTQLPRSKPLPKPKPPTKWEQFARAKGIGNNKGRRDRKEWDEEKKEWVNRWGWKGKNKELETQWAVEVPANAPADFDPSKDARDARKARVAKNDKQKLGNLARAQGASKSERDERKQDIDRTLATTRTATASMGKFDKKLDGEKKLKGVKRKFEPAEASVAEEKKANLALLSKLGSGGDSSSKKARRDGGDGGDVLNVRKAVRFASKGEGGVAMGRKAAGGGRGGSSSRGGGGSSSRGSSSGRGGSRGKGRGRR